MKSESKSLEISCYVLGAGAFGVFFRWMQLQLAYNDNNLPDRSVWNILVPVLIIIGAFVFARFVKKVKKEKLYLPGDFFSALRNDSKLFMICRWAIGGIMIIGSIYLFASCETDRNVVFLKILAGFGILTGIAFPLLLTMANKPHVSGTSVTLFSIIPIFFYATWLLTSYKQNSINPVPWDYAIEIITIALALVAAFRVAGFAYGIPNMEKSMFFSMMAGMMCVMSLADTRYLAQQIMLGASAAMFIMYNWIMVSNLQHRKYKNDEDNSEDYESDEGFERLDG